MSASDDRGNDSATLTLVPDEPHQEPRRVDFLADKIDSLSRRFDSFVVEMREAVKDMATVVRLHHARGLDNEERITAIENGFVSVKSDIATISQAAAKRLKKARTK